MVKAMASKEQLPVNLKDDQGNAADGVMHYTAYSAGDRTQRAVIALVACWLVAGVTLFIPIAHFFLVPAFLIAGPVMFFARQKQADAKEKTEGTCPRCKTQITIDMETNDKLPKWTYCPNCDGSIEISEKTGD